MSISFLIRYLLSINSLWAWKACHMNWVEYDQILSHKKYSFLIMMPLKIQIQIQPANNLGHWLFDILLMLFFLMPLTSDHMLKC